MKTAPWMIGLAVACSGLAPAVTVVNWNFDKREESLRFFAEACKPFCGR